jgi:hypothetical protein
MQGLDVPKDIVTGLANVKYSNALQIDESLYKAHIEPLMLLIVDALTVMYLRPYLIANGYPEAEVNKVQIWYDPSQVATRNDRAADADGGFDKMAVSFESWRKAHGFSETDAPSPNEVALRLLIQRGAITPELTEAMLKSVAPDVFAKIQEINQLSSPAPLSPDIMQAAQGVPATEAAPAELAEPTTETPTPTPTEAEETPVPLAEPSTEG